MFRISYMQCHELLTIIILFHHNAAMILPEGTKTVTSNAQTAWRPFVESNHSIPSKGHVSRLLLRTEAVASSRLALPKSEQASANCPNLQISTDSVCPTAIAIWNNDNFAQCWRFDWMYPAFLANIYQDAQPECLNKLKALYFIDGLQPSSQGIKCDESLRYEDKTQWITNYIKLGYNVNTKLFLQILIEKVTIRRFNMSEILYSWDKIFTHDIAPDAVIFSGSQRDAWANEGIPGSMAKENMRLIASLAEKCIRMLGVCYGHQIVNRAFGGTVSVGKELSPPQPSEWTPELTTYSREPFTKQLNPEEDPQTFLNYAHGDWVTTAGANLRVWAVSHANANWIEGTATMDNCLVLTLQGHPEFLPRDVEANWDIIGKPEEERKWKRWSEEKWVAEQLPTHVKLVKQWLECRKPTSI